MIENNDFKSFKDINEFISESVKRIPSEEYRNFAQILLSVVAGREINKKFKEADIK